MPRGRAESSCQGAFCKMRVEGNRRPLQIAGQPGEGLATARRGHLLIFAGPLRDTVTKHHCISVMLGHVGTCVARNAQDKPSAHPLVPNSSSKIVAKPASCCMTLHNAAVVS